MGSLTGEQLLKNFGSLLRLECYQILLPQAFLLLSREFRYGARTEFVFWGGGFSAAYEGSPPGGVTLLTEFCSLHVRREHP